MPIIVQQKAALEPETIQWAANVLANGGTFTEATLRANDNLLKNIKTYNLRSSIQHLITFSGDQLAAALCPIIYDIGTSVATNHNFVAGDLTSEGLSANNVGSKYLEFGFDGEDIGSEYNYHCSFHRTNVYDAEGYDSCPFGVRSAIEDSFTVTERDAGGFYIALRGNHSTRNITITNTDCLQPGFCVASRTSSTSAVAEYKTNGVTLISGTQTNAISLVGINYPMVGFARSAAGTLGYGYSHNRLGIISFGYGMDATQRANYRTCINNFLSRMERTTFQ